MPDVAFFTINLLNTEGTAAEEPNSTVNFVRSDRTCTVGAQHVVFPPQRRFALPAYPTESVLFCEIAPSLYRPVQSRLFTPDDAKPQEETITVLRLPDAWQPEFIPQTVLPPDRFQALTKVIANSTQVDVKHGRELGRLDTAYETLTAPAEILAKMALLNLYAVTTDTREPISNADWFSFVTQIVRIDRERFIAEVKPELYDIVQKILNNLSLFKKQGFFTESASLHYDNIPSRYTVTANLITVKVRYEQGNVQFTMGTTKCNDGRDVVILDCDMDEHSNIIGHIDDLFTHVFTGGTHPVDMHEYIMHKDPGVKLGYTLRPAKAGIASAATA